MTLAISSHRIPPVRREWGSNKLRRRPRRRVAHRAPVECDGLFHVFSEIEESLVLVHRHDELQTHGQAAGEPARQRQGGIAGDIERHGEGERAPKPVDLAAGDPVRPLAEGKGGDGRGRCRDRVPAFEQCRNTGAIPAMRRAGSRYVLVGERSGRRQRPAYIVAQRVGKPVEQVAALAPFLGQDERPEGLVPSFEGQGGLDDFMAQSRETRNGGADGRRDAGIDGASFRVGTPGIASSMLRH